MIKDEDEIKKRIIEWAYDQCFDGEDCIASAIAETNCIFDTFDLDDTSIEINKISDGCYQFTCNGALTGEPRKDDVTFCGDRISVFIKGKIEFDSDEEKWEVSEYEINGSVDDWR